MTDTDGSGRAAAALAVTALFAVLATVSLGAVGSFPAPAGFPADASIVHNIGYALFDIGLGEVPAEGFLAAFLIIALALDVALDAAVYLAKREDEGSIVSALTDGGRDIVAGDVAEREPADKEGDR
jgi:NADH-quinone oxidoreductase subunit J